MTGYTVHTGSTEKFTQGWDDVFGTGTEKKQSARRKKSVSKAVKKSTRKKIGTGRANKQKQRKKV